MYDKVPGVLALTLDPKDTAEGALEVGGWRVRDP